MVAAENGEDDAEVDVSSESQDDGQSMEYVDR